MGNRICHEKTYGAVHGFKIGKDDPQDSNKLDMFLMYTGKDTFDAGDSEIYKIQLQVSFEGKFGGQTPYVKTLTKVPWATNLWQKTLQKPHDVGVDHAWVDDDGKYVWVGTFRNHNDGVHMLEYDTGKIIHSVHGIADSTPGKYGYTAGVFTEANYFRDPPSCTRLRTSPTQLLLNGTTRVTPWTPVLPQTPPRPSALL